MDNSAKDKLLAAKSRCQQAILDAIIEFEKSTGLEVDDLRFNKGYLEHKYDDFDVIHPTTITIVVSL